MSYYDSKYLKYKTKYLEMKGGALSLSENNDINIIKALIMDLDKLNSINKSEKDYILSLLTDSLDYTSFNETMQNYIKKAMNNAYETLLYMNGFLHYKNIPTRITLFEHQLIRIATYVHSYTHTYTHGKSLKSIDNDTNKILLSFLKLLLPRFFKDGNIDICKTNNSPWIVVVMGLNAIRKTTAMKQLDLPILINSVLPHINTKYIPTANNSFFRQLDYLVPSIASGLFLKLRNIEDIKYYKIGKQLLFSKLATLNGLWLNVVSNIIGKLDYNMLIEATGTNFGQVDLINDNPNFNNYNKLIIRFNVDQTQLKIVGESITTRFDEEFKKIKTSNIDVSQAIIGGTTTETEYYCEYNDTQDSDNKKIIKTIPYNVINRESNETWNNVVYNEKFKVMHLSPEYFNWDKAILLITPNPKGQWTVETQYGIKKLETTTQVPVLYKPATIKKINILHI
jgi:hypothetical protein